jgi:hypothetical protein
MSATNPSRAAVRDELIDRASSSTSGPGRTQPEVLVANGRDGPAVDSTRSVATGRRNRVIVSVETEDWFFRYWTVPDMPSAVRAAGAFARDPGAVDQSDRDAIEAYIRNPDSRSALRILPATSDESALIAATHPAMPSGPRALPMSVEFRPLDLFDKFGFDDGETLDFHVQALRAEGWCLGPDELLRAVVEAKVLPLLHPRPTLDRILSSHNNVRGLLAGHERELDDEDYDFVPAATVAWPASITVSTHEIL